MAKGYLIDWLLPLQIISGKIAGKHFQIDIKEYSDIIHKEIIPIESTYYINTFMMAMPSFWDVEIIPTERNLISQFSSGEKQRIYSISSIIYHIINLNSVEENKRIKEYKYINLILDEIELYYHPEWQRRFLSDLLSYIKKINPQNLKNIEGLNILFVTHSPFILSDIPSNSILNLKVDNNLKSAVSIKENETFGANIHDLLANDFFLKDGFMGEFAKTQIEETIEYLNSEILKIEKSKLTEKLKNKGLKESKKKVYENELNEINKNLNSIKVKNSNRKFHQNVIGLIGEPVLRNKLGEMMASIMSNENKKKYLEEQFNIIAKNAGININNIKFED